MKRLIIHPNDRSTDFLKVIYSGRSDFTVITDGKTTQEVNDAIKEHDHIIMMGHGTPQGLMSVGQFNRPKQTTVAKQQQWAKPKGVRSYSTYGGSASNIWTDEDDYIPGWEDDEIVTPSKMKKAVVPVSGFSSLASGYIVTDETADLLREKQLTSIWCNADQYMEWNDLKGFYTGMFVSETAEAQIIGLKSSDKWQVEESNYAFVASARKHIKRPPEETLEAIKADYGKLISHNDVAKYNYRRLYAR